MFDVVFTKVILSHRIFTAHFRDTHRSGSVSACKHLYDMYKFVFVHVRMCEVEWGLCVHWVCRTNWTWLLFLEVPVYFCFFVVFFLFFQNISFFLFFLGASFWSYSSWKCVCACLRMLCACVCGFTCTHAFVPWRFTNSWSSECEISWHRLDISLNQVELNICARA